MDPSSQISKPEPAPDRPTTKVHGASQSCAGPGGEPKLNLIECGRCLSSGEPEAVAIVDDVDGDLAEYKWEYSRGYASGKNEANKTVLMHREIMSRMLARPLTSEEYVDHINRQTLDNRRCNLRPLSAGHNAQNRPRASGPGSRLSHVYWNEKQWAWLGKFNYKNRTYHCGFHNSPEEAYAAVMAQRVELGLIDEESKPL